MTELLNQSKSIQQCEIEKVTKIVTELTDITLDELKERHKKTDHIQARNMIMALLYARGITYGRAACVFGMNHSSARNALKYSNRKIESKDAEYGALMGKVFKRLAFVDKA